MSDEIRMLLGEKSKQLDAQDLYGLLDVPTNAKAGEIKKAYFGLVRQLHPDKLGNMDLGSAASHSDKVFKGINEAFSVLTDPKRRAQHDSKLVSRMSRPSAAAEPPPGVGMTVALDVDEGDFDRMFQMTPDQLGPRAETVGTILHGRGSVLFAKGEHDEAERYLRRAVELSPRNAVFLRKLGWTLLQNERRSAERRVHQARPFLESAVAIDPYNVDARYCMAQMYRLAGEEDRYVRELQAVLRCDQKHSRAEVELRRLRERAERRAEAEATKGSFFGRLFKRK
ncbi:MAG: tetratricopeptide (TPR) repeat protein [Myxococcota bacterium]|jgi:tetratricopeptide (TPR) repeat protein